jgi:hypothetical protein
LFERFMTHHFDSEKDLFDDDAHSEISTPLQRKRNSLGFKLPIISKDSVSPPRIMSGQKGSAEVGSSESGGKASGTGKARGGSVIGVPGFVVKEAGSAILVGKDSNGQTIEFDAFNSVFAGAFPNSKVLEVFLNYLEVSGKLDFSEFIEGISYQGFDREFFIAAALKKVTPSVFCRFAILGAVRGSNFQKIVESCLVMPTDLQTLVANGTVIKRAKKRDDLTILRFTASIPHWVSFWLFKLNFAKKIEAESCPGWLQFPGAASLPMSKELRLQHISFCKSFSSLLPGGTFNGNIYFTAYCNPIPTSVIPSMLKQQLGIEGDGAKLIAPDEVRAQVSMQMVKKT